MRTTVILDDLLYEKLAKSAIERHGHLKSLSKTLNEILSSFFETEGVPKSMFGAWRAEKDLSSRGLREEGEPH